MCGGSGALISELWKPCLGGGKSHCRNNDKVAINDPFFDSWRSRCLGGCQGRGMVLKPESELQQAMETFALAQGWEITYTPIHVNVERGLDLFEVEYHGAENRTEALATAILQLLE